jgi:hypothetical protein
MDATLQETSGARRNFVKSAVGPGVCSSSSVQHDPVHCGEVLPRDLAVVTFVKILDAFTYIFMHNNSTGNAVAYLVKALCNKPEVCGFKSRRDH